MIEENNYNGCKKTYTENFHIDKYFSLLNN